MTESVMLNKIKSLFGSNQQNEELSYMQTHGIEFDSVKGYIVDGVVMNDLSEKLEYFSSRKLSNFNNLSELYLKSILINEKIDLEIATKRYVTRLGNNEENLVQFKARIEKLNQYYRKYKRDK